MEERQSQREEWTMHLNVKSAEAHQLAVQLAHATGDSITGAVTKAIKGELRRLQSDDAKRKRVREITARTASLLKDGPGAADIDALYYDEQGLPK
jgi:antitoxin VapB